MPAWANYMKVALADKKDREIPLPANIVEAKVDATSGFLGNSVSEYFIKGTEPTKKYVVERAYDILDKQSTPTQPRVSPKDAGGGVRLGLPPKGVLASPSGGELF